MTPSRRPRRPAERGAVALLATFVGLLLGGLSIAVLQEGLASRGHVERLERDVRALELAETGLARSEREITELVDAGTDGVGVVSGSFAGGSFEVDAQADAVRPERWTLLATGRHGRSTRRVEVRVRRRPNSLFLDALLSHDDLVFDGRNATDEWDSSLGSYASQAVNSDAGGPYAQVGGTVGSNAGFIEVNGSSVYIRGDAIPGPLHTVNEQGNPTVLGDTTPRQSERDIPAPPYEDFVEAYLLGDNLTGWTQTGGNLTYDPVTRSLSLKGGGRLTLSGGTYFFSSITLTGNSVLEVAGPSRVYVTQSASLSGGTIQNAGAPADLLLFAHPYDLPVGTTPTAVTVKVTGGSAASLGIYAPEADLTIAGGGHLFGAAVAKTIQIAGDIFVHYDKALGDLVGYSVSTVERIGWRERSSPRR